MTEELPIQYKCVYCDKTFTREPWFKRHTCKKKKDFGKLTDLEAVTAMKLYDFWRKRNGFVKKKKETTIEDFHKSPYANIFTKLVEFVRNNISNSSCFQYLNWLIDCNVTTKYWYNEKTAQNFRDWIITHESYMTQVKNSVAFITKWCSEHDMPLNQFFGTVGLGDAYYFIATYKISPWLLLGYDGAVISLLDRFSEETMMELDENIQLYHWISKINENDSRRNEINEYCKAVFE